MFTLTCVLLIRDRFLPIILAKSLTIPSSTLSPNSLCFFFFGSTGQSQLISTNEKKELISKIANHKLRKQFFLGTGNNSLNENIDLIKYAMEYDFKQFLIMPPAYYKGNTDEGVFDFYSRLIKPLPKVKIIIYNFEKLIFQYFFSSLKIK